MKYKQSGWIIEMDNDMGGWFSLQWTCACDRADAIRKFEKDYGKGKYKKMRRTGEVRCNRVYVED